MANILAKCFSNWRSGLFWTVWMIVVMGCYRYFFGEPFADLGDWLQFLIIWLIAGLFFTVTMSLLPGRKSKDQ